MAAGMVTAAAGKGALGIVVAALRHRAGKVGFHGL